MTKASSVFQVMSLKEDMADGVILAKLLEVLSKKKVKGVQKNPTLKAHCIDNLAVCLDFMRSEENIKLVSIRKYTLYLVTLYTFVSSINVHFVCRSRGDIQGKYDNHYGPDLDSHPTIPDQDIWCHYHHQKGNEFTFY